MGGNGLPLGPLPVLERSPTRTVPAGSAVSPDSTPRPCPGSALSPDIDAVPGPAPRRSRQCPPTSAPFPLPPERLRCPPTSDSCPSHPRPAVSPDSTLVLGPARPGGVPRHQPGPALRSCSGLPRRGRTQVAVKRCPPTSALTKLVSGEWPWSPNLGPLPTFMGSDRAAGRAARAVPNEGLTVADDRPGERRPYGPACSAVHRGPRWRIRCAWGSSCLLGDGAGVFVFPDT